jgi:lipopolysaccharide export system permease protein
VILTFGRFSSDGELTAMKASGIGLFRISVPVIMIGIIFSFLAFFLNDQVSSSAAFASRRVVREIGIKSPTAYLEEGTFIRGIQNYVIFIHEIRGNRLKNIRVYQPQEGKPTRTIVAEEGEINTFPSSNIVELRLFNGTSEEPSPTDPENFYKLNFKNYYMTLDLSKIFKREKIDKKTREMTINELSEEMERFEAQGIDPTPLLVEIWKKINMSLASMVLVLIGIPLGIRAHRSEKSIGFGISLVIFSVYWGCLLGGVAISLKGVTPPYLGVSLANIIFFVFGIASFITTSKR